MGECIDQGLGEHGGIDNERTQTRLHGNQARVWFCRHFSYTIGLLYGMMVFFQHNSFLPIKGVGGWKLEFKNIVSGVYDADGDEDAVNSALKP